MPVQPGNKPHGSICPACDTPKCPPIETAQRKRVYECPNCGTTFRKYYVKRAQFEVLNLGPTGHVNYIEETYKPPKMYFDYDYLEYVLRRFPDALKSWLNGKGLLNDKAVTINMEEDN